MGIRRPITDIKSGIRNAPEKLWNRESNNYGQATNSKDIVAHLNYPLKRQSKNGDPFSYNVISGSFQNHNL